MQGYLYLPNVFPYLVGHLMNVLSIQDMADPNYPNQRIMLLYSSWFEEIKFNSGSAYSPSNLAYIS